VQGDLRAEEMVVLRSGAKVQGDITAPRVVLEDGATFRGAVDMSSGPGASGSTSRTSGDKPSTSSSAKASPGSETTAAAKEKGGTGASTAGAVSP